MNYKIIKQEFMGNVSESVLLEIGDSEFESFPVDETNPRYVQFMAELEETE
jgi:hypothetical protein